ncbi:hypothetical protein HDU84_007050 [Entophlyctis sp. JEL0112]|nr:hypothetical protein HDU84_007050 [Entophlyctis sp. JEL0112]
MNYFTAIIAVPLFCLIWLFEVHLRVVSTVMAKAKATVAVIVNASLAISTLQMISCWFWLFGFVFSKTDGIFSEADKPDEETNCFGLVGAEWILAVFQMMTSVVTFIQMLNIRSICRAHGEAQKISVKLVVLFSAVLLGYTGIAWTTAWNRRCPQATPILPQATHYFYPVYLLVDIVTSIATLLYISTLNLKLENMYMQVSVSDSHHSEVPAKATQPLIASTLTGTRSLTKPNAQTGLGNTTGISVPAATSKSSSLPKSVVELAMFVSFQCKLTIVAALFACGIFVLQFMSHVEALSIVACVFCVCMYITYAVRRVLMLMKYCRTDRNWKPHWKLLLAHTTKNK